MTKSLSAKVQLFKSLFRGQPASMLLGQFKPAKGGQICQLYRLDLIESKIINWRLLKILISTPVQFISNFIKTTQGFTSFNTIWNTLIIPKIIIVNEACFDPLSNLNRWFICNYLFYFWCESISYCEPDKSEERCKKHPCCFPWLRRSSGNKSDQQLKKWLVRKSISHSSHHQPTTFLKKPY